MFIKQFAIVLVVALLLTAGLPLTLRAENQATVVINELLWMGSPASSADEWIELRNTTDNVVDLSGWKLTRRSSGLEVTMVTIPSGKSVEPRGFFLISNFAASSTSTQLNVEPDVVDTAVSLLNSGLEVKLYDGGGVLVDVADDGVGTPLAGKLTSGQMYASMARNGIPGDGTKSERWHTSTTSVNLRPDSPVLGTPRAVNDNVPPVVPAVADQEAAVGRELTFDISDAFDPDGDALAFRWDFGDGISSDAVAPSHAYVDAGTYSASVEAKDASSATRLTFSVIVKAASTTQPELPPVMAANGQSIISELLPNPEGADDSEFIELGAIDGDVDLSGWTVSDEGGTTYKFAAGSTLPKDSFLVVARKDSKIALNNSGDAVTLKKSDGTVIQEVKYSEAEESAAYAWNGGAWTWTAKPTPGAPNEFVKVNHPPEAKFSISTRRRAKEEITFDASDSTDRDGDELKYSWDFGDGKIATGRIVKHVYDNDGNLTVRLTLKDGGGLEEIEEREFVVRPALKKKSSAKAGGATKGKVKGAAAVRTLSDIKTASSATPVAVNGWVSAAPGVLGENLFYLYDGTSGMAVRASGILPKLSLNDAVEVKGERRTKNGEAYILVEEDSGVVVKGERQEVEPRITAAGEVDSEAVGALVRVTGEVTTLSGSRFAIDDGTGELSVYVRASTGFKRPALRSGDRIEVRGIVSKTTSGIRLLPRVKEDIRIVTPVIKSPEQPVNVQPAKKPAVWMYVVVAVALVAGAGVGMWRKGVKK
ncbi:MAG: lamin tail domain-containing protein [Candidatus Kerfeldbacteria bacterium]|nr:lamin tail domain-containing protein [Candidatus Kerfeldbacteria bacterium]